MLMFLHICSLVLQFVSNKILCSVYFFFFRLSFSILWNLCCKEKKIYEQEQADENFHLLVYLDPSTQLTALFAYFSSSFLFFYIFQTNLSCCHDKKFNAWLRNHIMQSFITQKPKSRTNREKFPYMPSLA